MDGGTDGLMLSRAVDIQMAPKVYIIIYSLYNHVYTLAQEVQKGLEASGAEAKIFQGKKSCSA